MRRIPPETIQRARELRHPLTPAEQLVWDHLHGKRLDGNKFRRQHPIGPYIVDFYCARVKLVVEIDGESHASQVAYDEQRTLWLESQGCTVIRFSNENVYHRIEEFLGCIYDAVRRLPS